MRIANTYLNISPFDLSGLGCLAIFTCIIYISRVAGAKMVRAPPSPLRPGSTSIQKFRQQAEFFLFYYEMTLLRRISRLSSPRDGGNFAFWTEISFYSFFFFSRIGVYYFEKYFKRFKLKKEN